MLRFLEKRKENLIQQKAFNLIQQNLSEEFKVIEVYEMQNIAELSDMVIYGVSSQVKARIDKSNSIHIRIESINGVLFEGFTQNYNWFLETFSF